MKLGLCSGVIHLRSLNKKELRIDYLQLSFMHIRNNIDIENIVILTYKVESLVELKFDPGYRVIGEYLSKMD